MPWFTTDPNLPYLVGLSRFPKFGARNLLKLKKALASPEAAWRANLATLGRAGLDAAVASEFITWRATADLATALDQIKKEDIKIVTVDDSLYPPLLKEIYDPPVVLYYKGQLMANEKLTLAVVGSRLISPYGLQITPEIISPLARYLTIVSGLAIGVDALAHLSALKAGGRTIAVLGSGVDEASIYPTQNRALAKKIVDSRGAVLSEYPPGTAPMKLNFPIRNRIISGLSLGTLVIEAAAESGSLITARSALEQNRDIFAVPAGIHSPTAAGANNLLKMGARPVTSARDILDALNIASDEDSPANKITADNPEEAALLPHLSREPRYVEVLIKASQLPTAQVMSTLTMMEIKGKVRNLGGMQYVLC